MTTLAQFRCSECGSRELDPVDETSFRCSYCGTVGYLPKQPPAPQPAPPAPAAPASRRTLALVAIIVLAVAAVILGVFVVSGGSEKRRSGTRRYVSRYSVGDNRAPLPPQKGQPMAEYGGGAVQKPLKVSAEVIDLTARPDSIGNIYFVGIYRNTGEAAIERPRVELTLLDSKDNKVAVATGHTSRRFLLPGEETPVKILVSRAPEYSSFKAQVEPKAPHYPRRRPKLAFDGVQIYPGRYGRYHIKGTVTNRDKQRARFVQIIVLVLDAKKKILGTTSGFLGQRHLAAGESSPFDLDLHQVDQVPASFRLDYDAMEAR
jgi:hypothetical protein